jgi:GDP-D-mannose dehydratase
MPRIAVITTVTGQGGTCLSAATLARRLGVIGNTECKGDSP